MGSIPHILLPLYVSILHHIFALFYKKDIMTIDMNIISNFPICGNCSQKEMRKDLKLGCFYCRFSVGIFDKGIVTQDVDATECVKKGHFLPYQ